MINAENNDMDFFRRRGFLTLDSTSRTVIWVVENYHSVLASEHSICNTLNRISNEFMMTKDNVSAPINFSKKVNSEKSISEVNLEVRCTMTVTDFESFQICQKKEMIQKFEKTYVPSLSTAELRSHLEVILEGEKDNHVTICAQGEVFQVHRTMLCSSSSVFAAMFKHDTSERTTNRIEITDVSVETVGEMLSFMYFGSTSKLCPQTAVDVYAAADKYDIMRLKKKCSDFLISNLSKETVLDIMILADRHGDEELKESTVKFLVNSAADIIESDEFLLFIENETELVRCIILHMLKNTSK
ncbi:speckle-type POZ protein-like isoform X1 [Argiope bruennichi]|uniref:speckle-type POZ protein-like isoform X1 n=1 Tax=Argiope bruennichi TaxID=94029 RepID=UPI002493FE91|nr:speckle-type POZ protein-like isoform X1 [Argiope bruennichi]